MLETARVRYFRFCGFFPHGSVPREHVQFGAVRVVKITLRVRTKYCEHYRFAVIGLGPLFVPGLFSERPLIGIVLPEIHVTRDSSVKRLVSNRRLCSGVMFIRVVLNLFE